MSNTKPILLLAAVVVSGCSRSDFGGWHGPEGEQHGGATFALTIAPVIATRTCTAVTIDFKVMGLSQAAPADMSLALSDDIDGSFYSDPDCTLPAPAPTIPAGATGIIVYYLAEFAPPQRTAFPTLIAASGAVTGAITTEARLRITAHASGAGFSCFVLDEREVVCGGTDTRNTIDGDGGSSYGFIFGEAVGIPPSWGAAPISQIICGASSCCLIADGGAWCWGQGDLGQIGSGNTGVVFPAEQPTGLSSGVTSIAQSGFHACAVRDGAALCWGDNGSGQLGDGSTTPSPIPVAVSGIDGISQTATGIAAGNEHSCAILADTSLWCWGSNSRGQLGDPLASGSNVPIAVPSLATGVSLVRAGRQRWGGGDNTCAIADGGLWCWGSDAGGLLGDGPPFADQSAPVAVLGLEANVTDVTNPSLHTCAVRSGQAWCWGENRFGALGAGDTMSRDTPAAVVSGAAHTISGAYDHTCSVFDGLLSCWGHRNAWPDGDSKYTPTPADTVLTGNVTQFSAAGMAAKISHVRWLMTACSVGGM